MFVSPSTVLYTTCPGAPGLGGGASDTELEELSKKLLANSEGSEGLRLQVVEKDGHYFTLNNTRLQVCHWLETRGHCHTVRIETVPLKSVPEGIKNMMVVPPNAELPVPAGEAVTTITYEPMERRPRTANDDDNEDHSGSDDSDGGDSDSSCDEFDVRDLHRRRRQSEESGEEEDASLL